MLFLFLGIEDLFGFNFGWGHYCHPIPHCILFYTQVLGDLGIFSPMETLMYAFSIHRTNSIASSIKLRSLRKKKLPTLPIQGPSKDS
jgi:hypothetical protein